MGVKPLISWRRVECAVGSKALKIDTSKVFVRLTCLHEENVPNDSERCFASWIPKVIHFIQMYDARRLVGSIRYWRISWYEESIRLCSGFFCLFRLLVGTYVWCLERVGRWTSSMAMLILSLSPQIELPLRWGTSFMTRFPFNWLISDYSLAEVWPRSSFALAPDVKLTASSLSL